METPKSISKLPLFGFIKISLIANILTGVSGFAVKSFLPPEIPLYYGMPDGSGQIAPSYMIILPAVASLVITLINILLASRVENDFLKRILIVASFGITVFSTVTTFKIIFLVGNL